MSKFVDDVFVGGLHFVENEFSNRLVQVSFYSGIIFYLVAYPVVFTQFDKFFPFKKPGSKLLFHSVVFALLMYLLTYYLFDPLVNKIQGKNTQ